MESQLTGGKDVIFDIDWQGTKKLKSQRAADVASVFILPPSMGELESRLRSRAQDSDEVVLRRMTKAASEISHWGEYDYVIINNDFNHSLELLRAILNAERCKRERQAGMAAFVEGL